MAEDSEAIAVGVGASAAMVAGEVKLEVTAVKSEGNQTAASRTGGVIVEPLATTLTQALLALPVLALRQPHAHPPLVLTGPLAPPPREQHQPILRRPRRPHACKGQGGQSTHQRPLHRYQRGHRFERCQHLERCHLRREPPRESHLHCELLWERCHERCLHQRRHRGHVRDLAPPACGDLLDVSNPLARAQ